MTNHHGGEEAVIDVAPLSLGKENKEKVSKPAWFDNNGQYTVGIVGVVAQYLMFVLSGGEFINNLSKPFASILFLIPLGLWFLDILKYQPTGLETVKLSPLPKMKVILMSLLNFITNAMVMAANVAFLGLVDKSYYLLASFPILGFILVAVLFCFELNLDQDDQQSQGDNEDNETMVKNCFEVGKFASVTCFGVQTAVITYCLKMNNPGSPTNHPLCSVIVSFLTLMLGCLSCTIASSPLQFQSHLMCRLLAKLPVVMIVFQGLVAVIVSAKFLNPIMQIFAIGIPSIVMFLVDMCQKSSKGQVVQVESMFGALVSGCITVISVIHPAKHEPEGFPYLTYSVFFFLLAIITSLIRMAFNFRPTCRVISYAYYAIPMVLAQLSFGLILIEFSWNVKGTAAAPAPA